MYLESIANLVIFSSALFVCIGRDWIDVSIAGLALSYALQVHELFAYEHFMLVEQL